MLTTIALLASLLPAPAAPAFTSAGSPGIVAAVPSWAFAPLSIPDEPNLPCLPDWVEFVDGERTAALMASVSPFAEPDASDPFDGEGGR
jgi:hypothetical protein